MAVVIVKSTVISNRDATPKVLTDAFVSGGELIESQGYCAVANGDSIASKYIMAQVPSNARVSNVMLQCSALGAGALSDIGVYYPSFIPRGAGLDAIVANSVISQAFFASAVDVASALQPTEVLNESGTNTIAKQEMPLWQALGLSADPGIDLDIVGTLTAAAAAAGFIALKVKYCKQ